jgi:hypothetical protein
MLRYVIGQERISDDLTFVIDPECLAHIAA